MVSRPWFTMGTLMLSVVYADFAISRISAHIHFFLMLLNVSLKGPRHCCKCCIIVIGGTLVGSIVIYASLLLILYYFTGSSVPSPFVLWIMRELPPSMAISVPGETRTLDFVSEYPTTTAPQHWTTIATAQNQELSLLLILQISKILLLHPVLFLHIKELKDIEPVSKTMKYLAANPAAFNESLRSTRQLGGREQ